jgi:hypothetical protein
MLTVIGVIVIVLALLVIVASFKPDTFRMERSTVINAAADKVFPLINDFHRWPAWSPWEKMDPNLKRAYSGASEGQGAVYAWEGNKKVGEGRMEITSATAPSNVIIKLDFLKPFEAHNTAEFTMAPEGTGQTRVTWAMHGPQPFMFKVMSIFFNMDKTVGKDFESGLANMKAAAEG